GAETGGADEVGLHLRQRSLVELGEVVEEEIADDEAEDGVAQELEGLVVASRFDLRFVRIRLVRQRPRQKVATLKRIADTLLEIARVGRQCHVRVRVYVESEGGRRQQAGGSRQKAEGRRQKAG